MDPITIAILSGAAGSVIGAFFGWLFGTSQAQEEISRLQKLVERLVQLNTQREAEIKQLRRQVHAYAREVESIKAARGSIRKFLVWLVGEHPDVLLRYQAMQEAENQIAILQEEMNDDISDLDMEIARLRDIYPDEMAQWGSRFGAA